MTNKVFKVDSVLEAFSLIASFILFLMMIHVSLDVFLRHFFAIPLPGTLAIFTYYYMTVVVFVPLALAELKDSHISIDVFTQMLAPSTQHALSKFTTLLTIPVYTVLAIRTWEEALNKFSTGASVLQANSSIITWPTYFVLPVSFALIVLVLSKKLVSRV
ncbi:TRAP transporter small permease [Marinobacter sp. 1-3A]|uniref:TRAP transporter small permease subunit n=1 Tax=Marinobacter sp. 1-3A TaxID=2582920 RepID=UPI001907E87A|nr:TRAP transporter small permease [Marinobacter sp. 1-3A]MBK1875128.1 TRAP transporter small permease [Marinobacter sp. 1-3A]